MAPLPASASCRTAGSGPVFHGPSGSVAESPRTPRGPRYPAHPSADVGRYAPVAATVYRVIHELRDRSGFVDNPSRRQRVVHAANVRRAGAGRAGRPVPRARSPRRSGPARCLGDDVRRDRRRPGQGQQERRTRLGHAGDDQVAAHRPGQVAGDRQAEARAGDPVVAGHPVEAFEDPIAVVGVIPRLRPGRRPARPSRRTSLPDRATSRRARTSGRWRRGWSRSARRGGGRRWRRAGGAAGWSGPRCPVPSRWGRGRRRRSPVHWRARTSDARWRSCPTPGVTVRAGRRPGRRSW